MSSRSASVRSARRATLLLASGALLGAGLAAACAPSEPVVLGDDSDLTEDAGGGVGDGGTVPDATAVDETACRSNGPDAWPSPSSCSCDPAAMASYAANTCQGRDWCLDRGPDGAGYDGGCALSCVASPAEANGFCGEGDGGCFSLGPDAAPPSACWCDPVAIRDYAANTCGGRDFCLPTGADGGCNIQCLATVGGQAKPCP